MQKYLLHIPWLIYRLLPFQFRKPFWLKWLRTLLFPAQEHHAEFFQFADYATEAASLNSQTLVLETILNRRFAPIYGGIFIDNVYFNALLGQSYIHFLEEMMPESYVQYIEENVPASIYASFLEEFFSRAATFIINVPIALQGVIDEDELKAVVAKYALADKTFKINYY